MENSTNAGLCCPYPASVYAIRLWPELFCQHDTAGIRLFELFVWNVVDHGVAGACQIHSVADDLASQSCRAAVAADLDRCRDSDDRARQLIA